MKIINRYRNKTMSRKQMAATICFLRKNDPNVWPNCVAIWAQRPPGSVESARADMTLGAALLRHGESLHDQGAQSAEHINLLHS